MSSDASTAVPAKDYTSSRLRVPSPHGFNDKTEGLEVASEFSSLIAGKTIFITGVAPGSLGATTALTLASVSPAHLLLSARSVARASPIAAEITSQYPNVKVEVVPMDLGSQKSVREAVAGLKSKGVKLDVLINNASIMATPYGKTADGIEAQFGVGHVGHFLLTGLLLLEGMINRRGRVVNVSSDGHRLGNVRFGDLNFEDGKAYNPWEAYGQVKTANMLFTIELVDRLKDREIKSFSLHPGVVWGTNLANHLNEQLLASLKSLDAKMGFPDWVVKKKSSQAGCATHVVAAFDPFLDDHNGAYLEDCAVFRPLKEWAEDRDAASRLWTLSEELVGEEFEF